MLIKSEVLRREVKVLSWMCWVSGLHPFYLDGSFSAYLLLGSLLWLSFNGSLLVYRSKILFDEDTEFVYKLLFVLNSGSIYCGQIIAIVQPILQHQEFKRFLGLLDQADFHLEMINLSSEKVSPNLWLQLYTILIQIAMNTVHFLLSTYESFYDPLMALELYAAYATPLTLFFIENKIRSTLDLVLWRMQRLNNVAATVQRKCQTPTVWKWDFKCEDVLECFDTFERLNGAFSVVRKLYSPILLMITCNILVIVVSTTFYTVAEVQLWLKIDGGCYLCMSSLHIMSVLVLYAWVFIRFSELYLIIRTSVSLSNQAKLFNETMYKIMLRDDLYGFIANEKVKLEVRMKREMNLTACGLFTIDYSLLQSIFAASVTYTVILMQQSVPCDCGVSSPNSTTVFSTSPTTLPP